MHVLLIQVYPILEAMALLITFLFTVFVKSCIVLAWFHIISFLQPKAAEPQGAVGDQLWVARHPRQPAPPHVWHPYFILKGHQHNLPKH